MVSEVEEEGAGVEACFNFSLVFQPCDLTRFSPVQQAEIAGDAVGDAVVALVGEGEYEVFSFVRRPSVSHSFTY